MSAREKPPVGMELTITLSFPPTLTEAQCFDVVSAFYQGADTLRETTGAVWVNIKADAVPAVVGEMLKGAHAKAKEIIATLEKRPNLRVVK